MNVVDIKATVEVDFHLSLDDEHTLALLRDVTTPGAVLSPGDVVRVTDGEVAHLAVVDSVNREVLSLAVHWDSNVPAA